MYVMRNREIIPFKNLKAKFTWASEDNPRSNQWYHLMSPFEPNNFCLKHFCLLGLVFEILSWII